jgi:hypothetical protein
VVNRSAVGNRAVNNSDPSPTYDWRFSPNLPEFISLMSLWSSVYLNCKESSSAIVGGSYDKFYSLSISNHLLRRRPQYDILDHYFSSS